MKKLFSRLPKKLLAVAVVAAMVLGVTTSGSALLGGDREVRPYTPGNTPGFNHVTFNSFTGVPNIGDERNFFTGKISGAPDGFYDPMNQLRAGDEILMRVYVHNNADESQNASGNGIAKNTRVRVDLPEGLAQDMTAHAFISADNAQPQTIEDTLTLNGEYPFQIEYVPGSARIKTNVMDAALSDSIVTSGVQIGYDALNGDMPGCFEYVALVTLKVKVKAPSYTLDKKVRVHGTDNFTENVKVEPGQKVDFVLNFKNVGSTDLHNVVLGDRLPAGFTYVPGTTEWYSYHTGYKWTKVAHENLFDGGIDVGSYGPDSSAFIRFTATVDETEELKCGETSLINTGFAKPKDHGTIQDTATVKVEGDECDQPSYKCEAVSIEKLGGRKVRVSVKAPSNGGAQFKHATINFGDGSDPKTTTSLVSEYEYKTDGTFKVTAQVTFTVDGVDRTVSSEACEATVTFTTPTPELPKTGASSLIGLFTIVTSATAVAHNVVSRRGAN